MSSFVLSWHRVHSLLVLSAGFGTVAPFETDALLARTDSFWCRSCSSIFSVTFLNAMCEICLCSFVCVHVHVREKKIVRNVERLISNFKSERVTEIVFFPLHFLLIKKLKGEKHL